MNKRNQSYANRIANERCKICFELLSDLHITLPTRPRKLENAFDDMWERKTKIVALLGDLTNNGYSFQMKACLEKLQEYPMEYVIALGNHDTYNMFYKHQIHIHPIYKQLVLQEHTTLYYDTYMYGIHFYILNSEQPHKSGAWYSDKQLSWLKENLAKDDKEKPVFVLAHHPLPYTHKDSDKKGLNAGVQQHSITNILKQHPNTIYISGHLHHSYSSCEVLSLDTAFLIDVPSFTKIQIGEKREQIGYQLQVYHDFVYIKTRDYASHSWILSNEFIINFHTSETFRFDGSVLR